MSDSLSSTHLPSDTSLIGPRLLHLAARALLRDDPGTALACVRWLRAYAPRLPGTADQAVVVQAVLPELEQLARARTLADVVRHDPQQSPVEAGLLADMVDQLAVHPEGVALFAAASRGDWLAARQALAVLAGRDDLPPRLAHHLALVYQRAAHFYEARDQFRQADPLWRLAWNCWLQWVARTEVPAPAALDPRQIVLRHLLEYHRMRLGDLLARNEVDQARRHWGYVQRLVNLVPADSMLHRQLDELTERFREDLATEYLLSMREAMRYGAIAEGWRADYEKGLTYLRRLLSLDRENLRLLTALVEICNDWFLDCYNNGDAPRLWEQVDRFTPFALQLARRIERRPGDLTARAALSDFYKFRGFITPEHGLKVALYREALRFNPANENVRDLLAELGEEPD